MHFSPIIAPPTMAADLHFSAIKTDKMANKDTRNPSCPLPVVGKHPGDVKVIRFFVHSDPLHTQLPVKLDETVEIIVEIFRTDAYRDFHPTHPLILYNILISNMILRLSLRSLSLRPNRL